MNPRVAPRLGSQNKKYRRDFLSVGLSRQTALPASENRKAFLSFLNLII